jgi:hypothetical protein
VNQSQDRGIQRASIGLPTDTQVFPSAVEPATDPLVRITFATRFNVVTWGRMLSLVTTQLRPETKAEPIATSLHSAV